MKSFTAVVIIIVLCLLCGWTFGIPLPTVLTAKDPFEDYVVGSYRSGGEPTIMRVQSYCFSNLDVNASKNMTKVMTRINGRNVIGWGYNVDEAKSDAISMAESANQPNIDLD